MKVRWGFIGAGRIIPRFMVGFRQVEDAVPAAIYARRRDQAQALADEYGFGQVFDDIDEFISKADIDVAYVAVPNAQHLEFTLKCLKAGIPVLCEKAMGANREHETAMIECARANDVFLAEAFWTRMFPATQQVTAWIREGKIGDVVAVNGTFAYKAEERSGDRLFEPSMAGGTLLDIGVYLIQEADLVFGGPPKEIATLSSIGPFGTDNGAGIVLKYNGGIATLMTSFKNNGKDAFTIFGTEGMIEIFEEFWRPRRARLTNGEGTFVYGTESDFSGEGHQFEIRHINECLEKGLKESPLITLEQSLDIITTCDSIRKQWGLVYPFEK